MKARIISLVLITLGTIGVLATAGISYAATSSNTTQTTNISNAITFPIQPKTITATGTLSATATVDLTIVTGHCYTHYIK